MLFHPDYVREKIKASQLMNRLQSCALGEIELTLQQIRAAEILLRKCVPDLSHADISQTVTQRSVIYAPSPLDLNEWLKKYGTQAQTPTAQEKPQMLPPKETQH